MKEKQNRDLNSTSKFLSLILRHKPETIGITLDEELSVAEPPEYLYHGTGQKYVESIGQTGLIPKSRLYVHLSGDADTAVKVGSRHGSPVVYRVASGQMQREGYVFYRSVNGVWLTREVPAIYLEKE